MRRPSSVLAPALSSGLFAAAVLLGACAEKGQREDDNVPSVAQMQAEEADLKFLEVTSDKPCQGDADCAAGSLCYPGKQVCYSSFPNPRLLDLDLSDTQSAQAKECQLVNVYFAFDSAELVPEAQRWLEYDARCIKARQLAALTLGGNADARGTRAYNRELAARRAEAVKRFLAAQGVSIPLTAVSYGEERPLKKGRDERDFAWNRRVVLRGPR